MGLTVCQTSGFDRRAPKRKFVLLGAYNFFCQILQTKFSGYVSVSNVIEHSLFGLEIDSQISDRFLTVSRQRFKNFCLAVGDVPFGSAKLQNNRFLRRCSFGGSFFNGICDSSRSSGDGSPFIFPGTVSSYANQKYLSTLKIHKIIH